MAKRKPRRFLDMKQIEAYVKWYKKRSYKEKSAILAGLILSIALPLQSALIKDEPVPLDLAPLETVQAPSGEALDGCVITGCSFHLCLDQPESETLSTCEYKDEYACLTEAICERQPSGRCGWSINKEYSQCIQNLNQ
jgi:hypothetical protein